MNFDHQQDDTDAIARLLKVAIVLAFALSCTLLYMLVR